MEEGRKKGRERRERRERREKKGRGGEEIGTARYASDILLFVMEDLNFDYLFLDKTYF